MPLYHPRHRFSFLCVPFLAVLFVILLAGCSPVRSNSAQVVVRIQADGGQREVKVLAGSTVQDALTASGTTPGELDRVEPPLYTVLTGDTNVRLTRIREEFVIEQVVIPYEEKILRNESLPAGKEYSLQAGQNGTQELTTRRVFEDGVEASSSVVKSAVVKEAIPQIKMVGVQKPFAPIPISGRLVYLVGGDAWIMEGSTGNRAPVVATGDLDGRIFSLSPDGKWLLYTRSSTEEGVINTLWAAKLDNPTGEGIQTVDLKVKNVIHFAAWKPKSTYTIAYSTVEPRAAAPGWQANNDLLMLTLNSSGELRAMPPELETNMGGNYGWWGMNFAWAPDGIHLAYMRPDGVGMFEVGKGIQDPFLEIVPLQTRGDWAWVPGLSWGPDGKVIYTVTHSASPGAASPEESPDFDLIAAPLEGGAPVSLTTRAGMFSYPLASPAQKSGAGEFAYQIAYLQANNPNQSENSRYYVMVMDRDGSNRLRIFPGEGSPGLEPQGQWGVWSPQPLKTTGGWALAVIYEKNLWVVDTRSGEASQITGDNLLTRVDWK
jgi:resuscitation-promoting factor RpfB